MRPALLVIALLSTCFLASAAVTFGSVPTGGGGFVTGILNHRTAARTFFRTDVGGVYTFNSTTNIWTNLINWPTDTAMNIETFAYDRQNPSVLWIAQGKTTASAGSIMKYNGTKWTTLSPTGLKVSGNDDRDDSTKLFRWSGERMGVDPFVSSRVIHVSRQQGVFITTNGGTTWSSTITGLPAYSTARTGQVVFDDRSGVVGTVTSTYIVIESLGVFRGTTSFSRIDNLAAPSGCSNPPIATLRPMRTRMAGGYLYIAFSNAAFTAGAVWRYAAATKCWTNVTPGGSTIGYAGLDVDVSNPKRIIVSQDARGANAIFRCTNTDTPSTTCAKIPVGSKVADVPWWPSSFWAMTIADFSFDPLRPGRAMYSNWFGVWFTDNVWANSTVWTSHEMGHEEIVGMTLATSKACPLLAGGADVNGFCHSSLNTYPTAAQQWNDAGSYDATGVAVAPAKVSMVVRVGGFKNGGLSLGVSGNGGQSFTSIAKTSLPAGEWGKVALNANGSRLVWVGAGSTLPYTAAVSYNATSGVGSVSGWAQVTGLPTPWTIIPDQWGSRNPIAADPTDSNRFYIYQGATSTLYVSTNGGKSFTGYATGMPTISSAAGKFWWVFAAPGATTASNTELYIGLQTAGLWKNANVKSSPGAFTKVAAVNTLNSYAVGGRNTSPLQVQLLVLGTVNSGPLAFYYSNDRGTTWTSLGIPKGIHGSPSGMQGDDFVSNRFYMITSSTGFGVLNFTSTFTARAALDGTSSDSHSHLAPGVVAAICIAAVLVAVVAIGAALFVYKRRQSVAAADTTPYESM